MKHRTILLIGTFVVLALVTILLPQAVVAGNCPNKLQPCTHSCAVAAYTGSPGEAWVAWESENCCGESEADVIVQVNGNQVYHDPHASVNDNLQIPITLQDGDEVTLIVTWDDPNPDNPCVDTDTAS